MYFDWRNCSGSVPRRRPVTVTSAGGPAGQTGAGTGGAAAQTAADRVDGGGHGLVGMRERTAMLGGSLDTGPTDDGGFQVTAVLPVSPPEEAT